MRIVVVEDDARLRASLVGALSGPGDLDVVGQAGSVDAGLAVLRDARPDVALIDLGLPDGDGVDLIRWLRAHVPDCDAVVVSVFGDETHVLAAIQAGATGYLLKDIGSAELVEQLRTLRCGGSPVSPVIARQLLMRLSAPLAVPLSEEAPHLSPQEMDVLRHAAKGFTHDEIAKMMGVSRHTVLTYVKRCYRKLQVHSKTEAVYEARRIGVLRD